MSSPEHAYVPVDPSALLGHDGHEKLQRIAFLLAGGLGYEGFWKWLAMWPDIDTALERAEQSAESVFT